MKTPKPAPNADTVPAAAMRDLLATVQSQHATIHALLEKVRELETGEGWKAPAPAPFTDSITTDTSAIRLPE